MLTVLLKKAEANIARYKMGVIAAAYFNVSSMEAVAMFNGIAYHSPPISVNLISNVKLQNNSNTADSTISTVNQPIDLKTFAVSLLYPNIRVTHMMWVELLKALL